MTAQRRILLVSSGSRLSPVLRTVAQEQQLQVVQAQDAQGTENALRSGDFTCALLDLDSLEDRLDACLHSITSTAPSLRTLVFSEEPGRPAARVQGQGLTRLEWTRENLEEIFSDAAVADASGARSAQRPESMSRPAPGELQLRVHQLTTLYQIGRAISESRNWTEALEWFLATLRDQLDVRGAAILLYSRENTVLAPRTVLSVAEEDVDACVRVLLASFPTRKPFADIHPLDCYAADGLRCKGHDRGWRFTVLPLLYRRRALGFLLFDKSDWESQSFSEELFFLQTVQTILAEEVANAVHLSSLVDLKNLNETVLESIESGVITFNSRGEATFANRLARRLLGLASDEEAMPPLHFESLFASDAAVAIPRFQDLLVSDDGRTGCEGVLRGMQERSIPVRLRTSRIINPSDSQPLVLAAFEDLTEQRLLQKQVRRADRLRSLGELSAAIAHEVRNPLQGISLTLSNLKDHLQPEADRYVKVMFSEMQRLDGIVGSILNFASPAIPQVARCSMHDLGLRVTELTIERAAKREVHLDLRREMRDEWCELDEGQILQVLLNLVRNAIDASPAGGTVQILVADGEANSRCRIEVSDQGAGIAEEARDKLFDPFFTTKGEGTGLGLSVSLKIIEEHHGSIQVQSEPGRGARFVIDLPRNFEPGSEMSPMPTTRQGISEPCV